MLEGKLQILLTASKLNAAFESASEAVWEGRGKAVVGSAGIVVVLLLVGSQAFASHGIILFLTE